MKKLVFLPLVLALVVVVGCGKKSDKKDAKKHGKHLSQSSIPVTTKDSEQLLTDGNVSDFAFTDLDEYGNQVDAAKKTAKNDMKEENVDFGFQTVNFNFNENDVKASEHDKIVQNAEEAQKAVEQGKELVVVGNTCQIGSASYNLALSLQRAVAVKNELVSNGIAAEKIKTIGKGYESPLVWSDATDRETKIIELSANRRAEVLAN